MRRGAFFNSPVWPVVATALTLSVSLLVRRPRRDLSLPRCAHIPFTLASKAHYSHSTHAILRTDAYYGTSTKIRDTLNNLILKQPQSWQTTVRHTTHRQTLPTCSDPYMLLVSQVGLPFRQIQGTVVEWDEVRFDVRLMQRVPYEGVSRMRKPQKTFKHVDDWASARLHTHGLVCLCVCRDEPEAQAS